MSFHKTGRPSACWKAGTVRHMYMLLRGFWVQEQGTRHMLLKTGVPFITTGVWADRSLHVMGSEFCTDVDSPAEAAQANASTLDRMLISSGTTFSWDSMGKGACNNPQTDACAYEAPELKLNLIFLCLKEKPHDTPALASVQHRREGQDKARTAAKQACFHNEGCKWYYSSVSGMALHCEKLLLK